MKALTICILVTLTLNLVSCAGPAKSEDDYLSVSTPKETQRSPESVAARMIEPAIH